jgi:hypothetical protein
MRQCVCFVYANMDGELKPVGTAFFLGIMNPPVRWIVVVTALHVVANAQAKSDDGKTLLRVNTKDGGFKMIEVTAEKWFKPDMSEEIVDIAFCQWEQLPSATEFDFLCVGTELAASADVMAAQQIGVGSEVAFAGLFVNHHGQRRNEPVVRFGNICAMPVEPVSTEIGEIEAYLVESRSAGGLSGSPVFVDVGPYKIVDNVRQDRRAGGNVLYLLGVINGHWDALVKKATVDDGLLTETEYVNKGIALVTPIDKVLSVIQRSKYGRAIEAAREAAQQKLMEVNPTDLTSQDRITVTFQVPPNDAEDSEERK